MDVVIVGAGPAGTATALSLLKAEPQLAGNILLLDKAVHPRDKICAGGLIPHTLHCLDELDIPLNIPHVQVDRAFVRVPSKRDVFCNDGGMCSIIRRNEFDFLLVQAARARGAIIRQGEKVVDLVRGAHGVQVITDKERYAARVVVGADGSGSRVRRLLVDEETVPVGKAVMCDVPVTQTCWDGFAQQRYDFNFRPVSQGLKGYLWAFPCLIDGVPHVNIGIYSLGDTQLSNTDLRRMLADEIALFSTAESRSPTPNPRFQAFPIRAYHPTRTLAAPHVVLAGDAAGAEPLMGEGISFALEYGKFAAQQILPALHQHRFDFTDYTPTLAQSDIGKKLTRLSFTTKMFYGPTSPLWFALAARSRRLQSVGLKWYNGVDGWHHRSGWDAVRAVLRPRSSSSSRRLGT